MLFVITATLPASFTGIVWHNSYAPVVIFFWKIYAVFPAYCIPTKEVIKYFDLDIEFLKSIAYFDKEINDGLPK